MKWIPIVRVLWSVAVRGVAMWKRRNWLFSLADGSRDQHCFIFMQNYSKERMIVHFFRRRPANAAFKLINVGK